MSETSTKPYLIRALHEWCTDNGYTPFLTVTVDARTVVPREHMVTAVWGREFSPMSRTIDTHISRVRNKLGLWDENGVRLVPVYTYGYRLELLDEKGRGPALPAAPPGRKKGTRRCLSRNS